MISISLGNAVVLFNEKVFKNNTPCGQLLASLAFFRYCIVLSVQQQHPLPLVA